MGMHVSSPPYQNCKHYKEAYVKKSGDAMTGNLDMGAGNTVDGVDVSEIPPFLVPTGAMLIWSTDTAPTGWLLCYGQAVSRSTYGKLFTVIGTTFGIGDGSTTFNLPDLRGRLPLGQDDMGGTPANRITNAQADSIGGSSGAEDHTLLAAEMPAHLHTIPEHTHTLPKWEGGGPDDEHDTFSSTTDRDSHPINSGSWSGNSGSVGSDNAHNNVQPYLTTNYIIKH